MTTTQLLLYWVFYDDLYHFWHQENARNSILWLNLKSKNFLILMAKFGFFEKTGRRRAKSHSTQNVQHPKIPGPKGLYLIPLKPLRHTVNEIAFFRHFFKGGQKFQKN